MTEPTFWLFCNLLTIVALAFFSMEEMAAVSFNKVKLQFYVSNGNKKAIQLNHLLKNPSILFGTSLIGVNVATFIGSECARKFHESISLSPDLAPISQFFLVIIFGELAPMFAARRYPEHVALIGVPIMTFCSWILYPFIHLLGMISKFANRLFGGQQAHADLFLTEEELKKLIEDQDDDKATLAEAVLTSNIFRLRTQVAGNIMSPLSAGPLVSSNTTVGQLRKKHRIDPYVIVYNNQIEKILGVVYIKQLLKAPSESKIHKFCSPVWFCSTHTPLMQMLKQFRHNSEDIAFVLNDKGKPIGYLVFEDILDSIFTKELFIKSKPTVTIIDRTISGKMLIKEVEKEFGIHLQGFPDETLSAWIIRTLDHHPEIGETISFSPYELIIKESSLLEIKEVRIRTLS